MKKKRKKIKSLNYQSKLIINKIIFVERYNFKIVEEKWQKFWEEKKHFQPK